MKINKLSAAALMVLVLIVLNVLFFVWTDKEFRGVVEWISYGFTMLAFVMACISIFRIHQDSDETYHLTTNYLPVSYFAVQVTLSAVAIYICIMLREAKEIAQTVKDGLSDLSPDAMQDVVEPTADIVFWQSSFFANHFTEIALSLYLLILVFYVINISIHSTATKATARALAIQNEEHQFIKESCQQLQRLLVLIKDPEAKKSITALYESIRYKATHTKPDDKIIQNEISDGIKQLTLYVTESNWNAVQRLSKELSTKSNLF